LFLVTHFRHFDSSLSTNTGLADSKSVVI